MNFSGARLLSILSSGWPRLCELLWRCDPFLWGLKEFLRLSTSMTGRMTAEISKRPNPPAVSPSTCKDNNQTPPSVSAQVVLLTARLIRLLSRFVVPEVHHRGAVRALHGCTDPHSGPQTSQDAKADLGIWRLVRPLYWVAEKFAQMNSGVDSETESDKRIEIWGKYVRILERFTTLPMMVQSTAERYYPAFVCTESACKDFCVCGKTRDAICLCQDATQCPVSDGALDPEVAHFRAKALEIAMQNRKAAREVEEGYLEHPDRALSTLLSIYRNLKKPNSSPGQFVALLILKLFSTQQQQQKQEQQQQNKKNRIVPDFNINSPSSDLSDFQRSLLSWLQVKTKAVDPLSLLTNVPVTSLSLFLKEQPEEAHRAVADSISHDSLGAGEGERERAQAAKNLLEKTCTFPGSDCVVRSGKEIKAACALACTYCGENRVKGKRKKHCAGCKLALYCCRACQKRDWKGKEKGEGEGRGGGGKEPKEVGGTQSDKEAPPTGSDEGSHPEWAFRGRRVRVVEDQIGYTERSLLYGKVGLFLSVHSPPR
eukprot:Cvel_8437.t2-p1 / transcript=Cvel_8437.t2 / gene=Cvel_8437 / organism=Chromera_velia_CCMP2878 / gene_product=hypothetical protein / transcript_product=hypothetical protein / location=Cvel_scaffold466:15042-16661(+) / protein_length=540 / sequence_SO=supercontig / SO=protein_coding / is_pseudo=false